PSSCERPDPCRAPRATMTEPTGDPRDRARAHRPGAAPTPGEGVPERSYCHVLVRLPSVLPLSPPLAGPSAALPGWPPQPNAKRPGYAVVAHRIPRPGRELLLAGASGPATAQVVRGGLGLAVARADALLVAADAPDTGGRGDVGRVPDLLPDGVVA